MQSYTQEQIDLYRSKHYDKELETVSDKGLGTWGGAKDYFLEYTSERVLRLDSFLKSLRITSILDFGCGKGLAADTLKQTFPHLEVTKYDPAVTEFSKYPAGEFELVLCFLVIHLPELHFQKLIAQELSSFSSKYIILTVLASKDSDDNYYPDLFPDFKVKMFKRWHSALPIPSHRGNDCITIMLEKVN
jgi:hypothetical protein